MTVDLVTGYPFAYLVIATVATYLTVAVWLALRGGR